MKKYLPHLIAVAIFLLLTFIYFAPLFSGKELRQSDINNWKGMSKEIVDFRDKTGVDPYWTNSMFGGMPGYQISAIYTGNLIRYINNILTFGLPNPANLVFLIMIGFYFLLIVLKVDHRVAIIGSVAFAFGSYIILFILTGHNSKVHSIGYMAPIIAGIILTYRGKYLIGSAISAIFLSLILYANHLQITYYLMLMVLLLVVTEFYLAFGEKRIAGFLKASLLLGVAAAFAFMSNITSLWATEEYGKYSTRGPSELTANKENQTTGLDRDYITDWSYGVGETFTLLIPDFKGGASEPIGRNNKDALKDVDSNLREYISGYGAYFGDQPFTGGPLYIGAIIMLLGVIGAFVLKGPIKWWLLASTALSIMLSWGRHFMSFTNFFLDNVPGYDKFRAVTTILVISQFTIPLLAVLAIDKMIKDKDFFKQNKKRLMYAIGIVAGITLLIVISPGTFTNFFTQREYQQVASSIKDQQNSKEMLDGFFAAVSSARQHILVSDATRSLLFILVASALVWGFARYRFKQEILIYGLLVLITIDLVTVDRRYLSSDDFIKKTQNAIPFPKTAADEYILQDTTSSYRVLNVAANIFNDASTSYYHQSIGGYHGAKLKRYKELIDYNLTAEVGAIRSAMQQNNPALQGMIYSQPAVNMLNTKYIIYNPEAPPVVNRGALGNAWFVSESKFVANSDSEMAAVNYFNPRTLAIIDQRYADKLNGFRFPPFDSTALIVLTDYKPNHLTYTTSSSAEQLAVFSEIYYDKGWNVYVDGKQSDYFRANYVLRAMRVPPGNHVIEFKFEPDVIKTGEKISFASSLIMILFLAAAGYLEWKKNNLKPEVAETKLKK